VNNQLRKIVKALSFTVFVFGLAGWWYIAQNAAHHPESLSWPLTHMAPWPREDTFGIICFGMAFGALFIYMYLREEK
jgi:hypothetical protein